MNYFAFGENWWTELKLDSSVRLQNCPNELTIVLYFLNYELKQLRGWTGLLNSSFLVRNLLLFNYNVFYIYDFCSGFWFGICYYLTCSNSVLQFWRIEVNWGGRLGSGELLAVGRTLRRIRDWPCPIFNSGATSAVQPIWIEIEQCTDLLNWGRRPDGEGELNLTELIFNLIYFCELNYSILDKPW